MATIEWWYLKKESPYFQLDLHISKLFVNACVYLCEVYMQATFSLYINRCYVFHNREIQTSKQTIVMCFSIVKCKLTIIMSS